MTTPTTEGLDRESLELILEAITEFSSAMLPDDKLLELDHDDEFPVEVVRAMCGEDLGVQLLFIQEEYGGMGGGALDIYRVCETLAGIDLGVATGVLATFLGSDPVVFGGTEEQQRHWLGRIANEGLLMAYCATEPEAGSDLGAMRTSATQVLEDGAITGYRISGNKQWISNGGFADLYSVLAIAPGGPSWFIVERGAEGLSWGKPEDKHGLRASNTSAVNFNDVLVPAANLVGGAEGKGLRQAQAVFGYTRLMVAAFGLGGGWAAMNRAIPYSVDRVQGGSTLAEKQGYTHKLIVPHAVRLEAARAFIEETAERLDKGEENLNAEGAIAKYFASESGNAAADAAIQAFGGYGYTREPMVEKIKRDVRITTIYEGTSEILEMTIARDRWRRHLRSRGGHYHQQAEQLELLHEQHPEVGANVAALGLHALAEALELARREKLTRNRHILFRFGEQIAWAECAASFANRVARAIRGEQAEKSNRRFQPKTLAAMSRVFARRAALQVATESLRWLYGGGASISAEDLDGALGMSAIHTAQAGLITDMDAVADALYERS
jgi:alkylation response protein AidB-like acyl-CoA dehydrogenase